MLAPRVEAKLLQELGIKKTDKVLEIGTGSGYMAALLAARAEHVVTVESRPELAESARQNLERAGVANVTVEVADGAQGWSQSGPYDAIVVSGSLPTLPAALLKQLRVGGRLAVTVGLAPVMQAQLITCTADGIYNTVNLFETVIPSQSCWHHARIRFLVLMQQIRARQLAEWLADDSQPKPILLDVREPWEFELCHLPDSLLIPDAHGPPALR